MHDLRLLLERIGFSQKEAVIYLTLLIQGRSSLQKIAKLANLPRSTSHHALRSLCDHGLLIIEQVQGQRMYQAEHPDRLRTLLHVQRQELNEKENLVETVLPRLKALALGRTRPTIRYIENLEGLRRMQKEVELMTDDILQIIGYDAFKLLYQEEATGEHRREVANTSRRVRSIIISSQPVELGVPGFEYCVLPPELAPIEGEMSICGNRLMLFSYAEGIIAIDIASKTLADTARASLEFAWKEACRLVPVQGLLHNQD